MVSFGRRLLLPLPFAPFSSFFLTGADAKSVPGTASAGLCKGPRAGANSTASAPARCQPWTVSASLSLVPSCLTPRMWPSSDGFSAWRITRILVAGIGALLQYDQYDYDKVEKPRGP